MKSLTKILVDFCTLPGTALGAEILWIYTMQWKNRISLIALALISFTYSNMHMAVTDGFSKMKSFNGPENIR
jgi:hypothetical protein